MRSRNVEFFVCLLIGLCFVPLTAMAEALGNGGDTVQGKLRELTHEASFKTASAASQLYGMIADLENLKKDNRTAVSYNFENILSTLDDGIMALKEAMSLPDSDFKDLDYRLTKTELMIIPPKYGMDPYRPVWQEIIQKSRKGGRAWIEQNIELNENLKQITKSYTEHYLKQPNTSLIWNLIRGWNKELYRSMYLSMLLYRGEIIQPEKQNTR